MIPQKEHHSYQDHTGGAYVSRTLESWDVREADFPNTGTPVEQLCFLLHYAVLAPSVHNTQPWLFKVVDDAVELYADRTRALPVIDPDDRELTISCGAALFHLRIALRYFGYTGTVILYPDADDPDLLARIQLGKSREASAEEQALFKMICKRRTNRQTFEQRAVPESVLIALQEAAHAQGAWLYIVQAEEERTAIADLIAMADRMQWADKHFRREWIAWTHPSHSQRRDGIPGDALDLGGLLSSISLRIGRTFDAGQGRAATDHQLAAGSPVLAVLGTNVDTPYDWLTAGQALEHILLYARSQEVWASFLNQPIEIPDMRLMLHTMIERVGSPQLLLRMGYGPEVPATPRRSVSEVLLQA
jgi:nitroreductase